VNIQKRKGGGLTDKLSKVNTRTLWTLTQINAGHSYPSTGLRYHVPVHVRSGHIFSDQFLSVWLVGISLWVLIGTYRLWITIISVHKKGMQLHTNQFLRALMLWKTTSNLIYEFGHRGSGKGVNFFLCYAFLDLFPSIASAGVSFVCHFLLFELFYEPPTLS